MDVEAKEAEWDTYVRDSVDELRDLTRTSAALRSAAAARFGERRLSELGKF
jgi:hypothetical protein